jgi:hypothetical protein
VKSKQQIERWNRITTVSLAPEDSNHDDGSINHRFSAAGSYTVPVGKKFIKMIHHVPEKFLP